MALDYFALLGLTPRRYEPREVARRFMAERQRALGELDDPRNHAASRRRLDELYLALAVLGDPRRQAEYLRTREANADPLAELRQLIAASLEDGLLRHSRRQMIIERARELGLNEFQAQLLIAQVQFGDERTLVATRVRAGRPARRHPRAWARVAAASVLGLALFLYFVHWLGA